VDTLYYVRVMALGTGDYSDSGWSVVKSAKTDEVIPIVEQLSAPTIDQILGQGEGKVTITWSNVVNANGYEIRYAATEEALVNATPVSTNNGWVSLPGFETSKTYYFQVRALGTEAYSDSNWSDAVSVAIDEPPTQTIFRSTDKTDKTVTLAWSAVNGATSYEIRYRWVTDTGSGQWVDVPPTTGTTAVVNSLNPGTTYEFQMRSRGSGSANSGWSTGIYVTTFAESNIVTAPSHISSSLAMVKGVKLDKKHTKPTQTSLAFTWYPAATFSANSITFDVLAPKPKGWAKKNPAPCVATLTIKSDELASILGGTSLTQPSGDCTFSITAKGDGGIEVKVSGLATGTKYTVNMQTKTGDMFSKVTKVSASTAKYAAPKGKVNKQAGITAGVGSVVFELQNSSKTSLASGFNGTKTGYEIGIYVGKECHFGSALIGFMAREGIRFEGEGITVTPTGVTFTGEGQVTVKGLASQKYTFGLREIATIDGTETESAIAKITASPKAYKAASIKQDNTAGTLTGTVSQTFKNGLPDGTHRGFEYTWYDDRAGSETRKQFIPLPSGEIDINESAGLITGSFDGLLPSKGTGNITAIGVREVIYDLVGNVIAKSALTKIIVKW